MNQPTQSEIRTAKRQAVGGGRKRCKKGKNCSAACIQAGMACLVEMPESAGVATTKVRDMLAQRVTTKGRESLRKKVIVRGNYGGGAPVSTLDADKKAPLSATDLDLMEKAWKRYTRTGELEFPYKMPKKYDNNSGTPEAVDEIVSLRDKLKQNKKTGEISIPEGTKISKRARDLINEWNSLDLSTVYVDSVMGNRLNVSGLGVQAGPRNSVPKDAVRGLVQYVALRRQQAELEDTPNGKRIISYRDPFTGQRRPYMIGDSVVASQDHWQRPFGIYGIRSENDVRNTVYMPASMNSNKGEASPGRYMFQLLNQNGRLKDGYAPDASAVGGFRARYDKDSAKDFLPKGITRDSERQALAEKARWMVDKANTQVNAKVVPKIEKALQGEVTATQAAALIKDLAKYESKTNYFGGDLRFANGARILTPYEQNLVKGIKLEGSTAQLQKNIQTAIESSGKNPKQILQEVLQNRQGYVPKPTGGSGAAAATPKVAKPTASTPKATKAPTLDELSKRVTETGKEWARLNGTPGGAAAKANFEKAKQDYQNAKDAATAAKTSNPASTLAALKQAANPKSTRGLTPEQDERVDSAARMTNFRIDRKLNERQYYDDATNKRIREANEKVVAPFQKMNENEKAALSLYGQDGVKFYQQVNQLLRTGDFEGSTPEKRQLTEFISGNLRSGLEKLPPAKVEELGRAVSGNFATSLSSLKPGDTIVDKGFGSYTNKGNPVYDQFFSKTEPNAAIRILNPKGAREVAPVMEYSQEGEHITLPGTRLRLVDVQEKGVYSRKTGGYIPQYTFEEIEG